MSQLALVESKSSPKRFPQAKENRDVDFSRDEMNLAEFPLAVLSTRVNSKLKTLEFSDKQRTPSGEFIERKWIITGADKFGLPTATDDDVVLGLMRLSMSKGFRERKVYFTRYELLRTLRWSTEGRSYQRLIKSLDRLSGVRIRSTNSFYDNSSKAYQTVNFGIIDAYEINDCRRQPGEDETKSFFVWSEALFDSFKAGYIKKLDLDIYFSLRSAIARRLYRYLDKHFYYKKTVERPLLLFAFEKIGLSRSYRYVSSVKQQLEPALEELVSVGFLSSYEFAGRGAQAVVRFRAAGGENSVLHASPTPSDEVRPSGTNGDTTGLVEALTSRGMAAPQARRLVGQVPRSKYPRVQRIIAYYDQLVARSDYKVSKNKVGFLYRAVERSDDFSLPDEVPASASNTRNAARPELKLFRRERSSKPASKPKKAQRKGEGSAETDPVLAKQLAAELARMSSEELDALYAGIEKKMRCLKSVLSEEQYQEAVEGCVREELLRRI